MTLRQGVSHVVKYQIVVAIDQQQLFDAGAIQDSFGGFQCGVRRRLDQRLSGNDIADFAR